MHRRLLARSALLCGALLGLAARADAGESAYCRKVEARAASDASLLMWPRLLLQGIRFPRSPQIDLGPTTGSGLQARVSVSYSPLDLYKGTRVLRIGDADCGQHEASSDLQDILEHGLDGARLEALTRELTFLEAHRAEWRALAELAEERLARHVITLVEIAELRRYVDELERKVVQVRGEAEHVRVQAVPIATGSRRALIRLYLDRAMNMEHEISHLRSLAPWEVRVIGGVIPQEPVDWYGVAEIGLNFGAFQLAGEESDYLAARSNELHAARYELEHKMRQYRKEIAIGVSAARRELEVVERELHHVTVIRDALEQSEAQNIANAKDTLTLRWLSLESDRAFLDAWLTSLLDFSKEDRDVN